MRWIKATESLPTDAEMVATPIVWRIIHSGDVYSNNANPKLRDYHGTSMIYFKTKYSQVGYPLSALVWLDESPSSDPAEVLELRQWKKEAMELLNPIMEYGRKHPDIKLGSSTTEFVLNRAKAVDGLVKALEKVLNPDNTQQQKQWAAEDALKQYEQLKQQ